MMQKRRPPLALLVMSLVLVAALVLCYLQLRDWQLQQETLDVEKQELQLSELRLAALQKQEQQKQRLEEELELLTQLLPDQPAEARLLVDLQAGADLSGMALLQVRYGEYVERDGFLEIPLELQLEGTYFGLMSFLDYLNLAERALRLQQLRVDENSETENLSVYMTASVFYVQE